MYLTWDENIPKLASTCFMNTPDEYQSMYIKWYDEEKRENSVIVKKSVNSSICKFGRKFDWFVAKLYENVYFHEIGNTHQVVPPYSSEIKSVWLLGVSFQPQYTWDYNAGIILLFEQ